VQTTPKGEPYSITGAPRVVKDKVVIGNGGGEYAVRGYFTAYDTATGKQAWRFYTVPGDPSKPVEHPELEAAMATWTGEWWKAGGGGTAWDSMVYDPELNLLYVGVGNGSPWPRYHRSPGGGDNLYLCSILAINPDTGRLVWYYQTTPGDNWDYTSVQPMMLAELEINGEQRKVLLQAPKNGFFYVLDRTNGEFISAQPYTTVNWATHIDQETGRPVEAPVSHYAEQDQLIYPGPLGGHNWQGMAFNPNTGYVYLPAQDVPLVYINDPEWAERPGVWRLGLDGQKIFEADLPDYKGYLIAWDPVAQKAVWQHEFAGYWNGGVLATGGNLVFQGSADGLFTAYDAMSGDQVWQIEHTTGIIAPPVSYSINGEQYIAVAAGYGGGGINGGVIDGAVINRHVNEGRVLAFKLGGSAEMPISAPRDTTLPEPPTQVASAESVAHGKYLYDHHCWPCHGGGAASSWVVPDLRFLSTERHAIFNDIVLEGALLPAGMPSFGADLEAADADAIHAYVIAEAHELKAEQAAEAQPL
jgi:quinohemoprotein ethanol dehydrogenase